MIDGDLYQLTEETLTSILACRPRPPMDDDDSNKRRTPRFQFVAPLEIFQELAPGSHKRFRVTTKDISLGGLGINCDKELLVNEEVVLVMKHDGIQFASHARVMNCQQEETGYRIGLIWKFD